MTGGKKIKVLHLARWYPHRYDPMFGLFVKRHVEAVSNFVSATVVYAQKTEGKTDKKFHLDVKRTGKLIEIKVYYRVNDNSLSVVKFYRYLKAVKKGIDVAKDINGKFDMVHVHILTRLGVVALLLKYLWRTPYVITEHWSRYQPVTGHYRGIIRKLLTKIVVKKASAVTTVTRNLAAAMKERGLNNENYSVLPNVIAPLFFEKYNKPEKKFTNFIHVSCFEDRSKNISGILRVAKKLSESRKDFKFTMIGEGADFEKMKNYAGKLNIPAVNIEFTGLLEGEALARKMAQGDLLVVFSNYENMPVVINESFALGIPVVATRVGGIAEIVDDEKGILIDSKNEKQLLNVLNDFIDKKYSFNQELLKEFAKNNFSYKAIGKQISKLYEKVLII